MGIKLRSLQLGWLGLDHELVVFPHPNLVLNTNRRAGSKHWLRCPVLSYVVEHPDGLLLWDTGISPFQDAGAELVVHEAEYRHVEKLRDPQRFWVPADFNLLHDVKPPTLVSGDEELMRGVRLIHLPGHSPGSMALLVELDHTGSVLLTGDALYTHDSYGPPPAGSPLNPDPLGWATSVEKLRTVARQREALVLPGHSETGIRQHHDRSEFTSAPTPGLIYE
jgi:glyoxylase-like metal-dependent hydrolase (beta-lactamase superfamily II)